MPKHLWSILCARSIIDKDTNSLSIIDVLEEINILTYIGKEENKGTISGLPLAGGAVGFQLMSFWMREDNEIGEMAKARLEIKSPRKKVLVKYDFSIDLTSHPKSRTKLDFPNVPLDGPDPNSNGPMSGSYSYKVQLQRGNKWVTVTEQYLGIKVLEQAAPSI